LTLDVAYLSKKVDDRKAINVAYKAWVDAYKAWNEETDAARKEPLLKALNEKQAAFSKVFPEALKGSDAAGGSSTAFIVIGVVLVLAAAVGGGLWYKKKQGDAKNEGGEADDRKLYKSQIASVNAHKKAQKVALVDADV